MKTLLYLGLLMIVLGIVSLVVPIPSTEKESLKAGSIRIGIPTTHSERASPIVSAVLIVGGIGLPLWGRAASIDS